MTAQLHFLGTGAAWSDPQRTTTMLALSNDEGFVLVDCGGDALQRALVAGLEPAKLRGVILTHEHADHVSGFPLLMERLWLSGRREPVPVYGIAPALAQARRLHDSFDIADWYAHGYPGVNWHEVPHEAGAVVFSQSNWHISAAPGRHAVPVIGLRVVVRDTGRVLAYSCDTEPCADILELAQGADVLVHEATGEGPGHSSAAQAAEVAAQAGARRLLLVHLPPRAKLTEAELAAARSSFPALELAEEGSSLTL